MLQSMKPRRLLIAGLVAAALAAGAPTASQAMNGGGGPGPIVGAGH